MAIDTKKIAKDAKEFKTLQIESDKYVKEVEDIYADSFKTFAGMAKAAEALMTRIAEGKSAMNTHLADIKRWSEQAKSVKSDAEKILRREADGSAYLDEMNENYEAAEKAAKADKNNKGLAAKLDLAEKALVKQSSIYVRINEEYSTMRAVLDDLHGNLYNRRYESIERAKAMDGMMKELLHTVKMIQFAR